MQFIENILGQLDNILLVVFGVFAFVCGLLMLILRDPMRVAMALVMSMISLGVVYGLLGVHFIAAFQILIYVGAVMVFMIYIIMLINDRDTSIKKRYSQFRPFAFILGVVFVVVFYLIFTKTGLITTNELKTFTINNFAKVFMNEYWFHFQLIAVLLMVAVIAAISLLRTPPLDEHQVQNSPNDTSNGGQNG